MVENGPLGVFATPFGALELNVLFAGLEAIVAAQVWRSLVLHSQLVPDLPASWTQWRWVFALYALVGIVAVFLVGLATEGLAGLAERAIIRKGGRLRPWYVKATNPPADWGTGQLWIWKSRQAADEFARRRLRILTSRNTWFILATLTITAPTGLVWLRDPGWFLRSILLLVAGATLTALFVWVWVSANEGWHRAVNDASAIGAP